MKIGIIGAGPRGLSMLERLLVNNQKKQDIQLIIFDPCGPGGQVWRLNQSEALLMNSISSQVTLFTDETISSGGIIASGPDLYQWSKQEARRFIPKIKEKNTQGLIVEAQCLAENEPASRRLFGAYQRWFFERLHQQFPDSIQCNQSMVTGIKKVQRHFLLETARQSVLVDALVLATGHWKNELTEEEQKLSDHAKKDQLFYQPPANPADVDITKIPAKEVVFIRGLGLSFFDYVALFTLKRGGRFEEVAGKMIYHSSGKEPTVYAGSRHGLPYFPRGSKGKESRTLAIPERLTKDYMNALHSAGKLTGKRFFAELKQEVELYYYKKVVEEHSLKIPKNNIEYMVKNKSDNELCENYLELLPYKWSWQLVDLSDNYQKEIQAYLDHQIRETEKTPGGSALLATFDALKDWRNLIHQAMMWEIFSAKEYQELLWEWFTPLDAFWTIGPPLLRTKELKALVEAGIFHFITPPFTVHRVKNGFYNESEEIKSRYLIEARLPKNDLATSKNPILQHLRKDGLVRSFQFSDESGTFCSGAIDVDRATYQVIDARGTIQTNLFCIGIPIEGVDWLTASVPRPVSDSWNLRQTDRIAQLILNNKN